MIQPVTTAMNNVMDNLPSSKLHLSPKGGIEKSEYFICIYFVSSVSN